MTSEQFNKLINLADLWLSFSFEVNGKSHETYRNNDISVWCYFSDNSIHKSVEFTYLTNNSKIEVGFFCPPTLSNLNCFSIINADLFIKHGTEFLENIKKEYEQKDQDVLANKKQKRIESLRKQLEELEGDDHV